MHQRKLGVSQTHQTVNIHIEIYTHSVERSTMIGLFSKKVTFYIRTPTDCRTRTTTDLQHLHCKALINKFF